MLAPGGISGGIAQLSRWYSDTAPRPFSETFGEWVRASGWAAAGIHWPGGPLPADSFQVLGNGRPHDGPPPDPVLAVLNDLRTGGDPDTVRTVAETLIVPFVVAGDPIGVLWAKRAGRPAPEDADFLRLSARVIANSPALGRTRVPASPSAAIAERLGDAARAAGRAAHDFDNVLTGVIGFVDLSLPHAPPESPLHRYLLEIGNAGQRGVRMTQQLHQLSRADRVTPHPGSVAEAVRSAVARVRPGLTPGHTLDVRVPDDLPPVAVPADSLGTVIGHLLDNAVEATPTGGTVSLLIQRTDLSPAAAGEFLGAAVAGEFVELTVRDTGPGVPPKDRPLLFAKPFFTTKVRHRGLGLATVFRTLHAVGGGVRFDFTGPGTAVHAAFPTALPRPTIIPTTSRGSSHVR